MGQICASNVSNVVKFLSENTGLLKVMLKL